MTNIFLVRHTQTVGNLEKRLTGRQDYELTKDGIKMVQLLTEKFKNIHIDAAYASTNERAIKTIDSIAKQKGIEIVKDERLCEMYFGIYDGWKWEDVNKVNPQIHKLHIETNEIMNIPNQETTQEVAERIYNCIEDIAIINRGKNILIASHGVAIEAFLREVSGEPFTEKREEYSQKNTSLNIIQYEENKREFRIKELNI